jgi:hypothetical protein
MGNEEKWTKLKRIEGRKRGKGKREDEVFLLLLLAPLKFEHLKRIPTVFRPFEILSL